MIIILIIIISLTSPIWSQITLDSAQVTKLINKLNEREYLLKKDSLITIELSKKDTLIYNLEAIRSNLERQVFNDDATIFELKKQLARVSESGLKWFHYAGGAVLFTVIGILTGLLIK